MWCIASTRSFEVLNGLFYSSTIVSIAHFITLVRHTASATIGIQNIQTCAIGITDIVSIISIIFSSRRSLHAEYTTKVFILRVIVNIHRCWTEEFYGVIHKGHLLEFSTFNIYAPADSCISREICRRNNHAVCTLGDAISSYSLKHGFACKNHHIHLCSRSIKGIVDS